jgi:predicted kinase
MILLVSGPPGAGKTTVARMLAAAEPLSVHVKGDAVDAWVIGGKAHAWLPEADAQNRAIARATGAAAVAFSQAGYFTVVDWVILPPMLAIIREVAKHATQPCHYAVLLPPVETVVARGLPRADKPAALTADVCREMHRQFATAAIDPRHIVESSGLTPEETAAQVKQRLESGDLRLD